MKDRPQGDPSVMREAVRKELEVLGKSKVSAPAAQAALTSLQEKLFVSQLVILPTDGVEDSRQLFDDGLGFLQDVGKVTADCADRFQDDETGDVTRLALQIKGFVDLFDEAARNLGDETGQVPADEIERLVARETHVEGDDGLEDPNDEDVRAGRAVRSAFLHWPPFHRHCHEETCCLPVECGGCGVMIKEFRGWQLRWVLRRITRWVEPWSSRRRLVFRWVWVLEWVPAQLIKTITVRCCSDRPTTHIQQRVVLDRALMNFWRCH